MQELPFQTPTQFVALMLMLIAGWLFGLASAPGGRKWRERYQDEELAAAAYRHQAETEMRELKRRHDELEAECRRLETRIAELEATPAAPVPIVDPNDPGAGWRGWFGWGRDNLARIRSIDPAREQRLNALGIKTYREIEKMTADDEAALETRLDMEAGTIAREEWREQAALLRTGAEEEHARRFG